MSDGYLAMMRKAQRLAERLDAEEAERDERARQYALEQWEQKAHLRCSDYTRQLDGTRVPCDQPVAYLGSRHRSWCAEHRMFHKGGGSRVHFSLEASLAIRRVQDLWRVWPEVLE